MSARRSYIAAAFNARPFGMPLPPNWLGLAAFGLLGGLVNPGFWLIGLGIEALYLWGLARYPRFRAVIDAQAQGSSEWRSTYDGFVSRLDERSRRAQENIERQGAELADVLTRQGAIPAQVADVRQLVWLHLKLLVARSALLDVTTTAERERHALDEQERELGVRLQEADLGDELRHSLEQQRAVIRTRRVAHADALGRRELVEAELERLRQQLALVREQALLATDEASVARSVDALSASLNEANRWLKDQREILAGLETFSDEPPPADLLRAQAAPVRSSSRKRRVSQ